MIHVPDDPSSLEDVERECYRIANPQYAITGHDHWDVRYDQCQRILRTICPSKRRAWLVMELENEGGRALWAYSCMVSMDQHRDTMSILPCVYDLC